MQETKTRKKTKPAGAVVSHTSILILSAFLIGVAAGKAPSPVVETSLYLLGVFGIVSYFGLGHLARQRQQRAALRRRNKAARKLEVRMVRHIPRRAAGRPSERRGDEKPADSDRQFMPVVSAQQMPAR